MCYQRNASTRKGKTDAQTRPFSSLVPIQLKQCPFSQQVKLFGELSVPKKYLLLSALREIA